MSITPQDSNYFYPQIFEGKNVGLKIDRFFTRVRKNKNVCLVSATIDSFTLSIFGGIKSEDAYNEKNGDFINYNKSSFNLYNAFEKDDILDFINKQKGKRGLLLSTRLDLLNYFEEITKKTRYKAIRKISDFKDGEYQVLIGSRGLFQGVDIPNIDFILLNKVPFEQISPSYKKKMTFFEKQGYTPFTYYTIPRVINQTIQCMGRLWRKPGDKGNIAIFDKKAVYKWKNMFSQILARRKGIRCYDMYEYTSGTLTPIERNF